MTQGQKSAFVQAIQRLQPVCFVHGDCVGADAEAHQLARALVSRIRIRPCDHPSRAWCTGADEVCEVRKPLHRNRDIVNDADVLIACPPTAHELRRSGTWTTIRYARKRSIPIVLLLPDGTVTTEGESRG